MITNFELAAAHIGREVPATEACLDDALIAVSSLIRTMVEARKSTDVPPATGQATIARLAKAQMTLLTVSSDVLRVHKDLASLAKVHAGMDLHECPKNAQWNSNNITRLAIAS